MVAGIDPGHVTVPPTDVEQAGYNRLVVAVSEDACGDSSHNGIGGDILGDHSPGKDNSPIRYSHSGYEARIGAYPDVGTYDHGVPPAGIGITMLVIDRLIENGDAALPRIGEEVWGGGHIRSLVGMGPLDDSDTRTDGGEAAYAGIKVG